MGMGSWRCTDATESTKKITLLPQKDAVSEGVTVREVLKVDTKARSNGGEAVSDGGGRLVRNQLK